jgi:hypothetical protein
MRHILKNSQIKPISGEWGSDGEAKVLRNKPILQIQVL